MNLARLHAKTRKPTIRWSQPRRRVIVKRKEVTPEEFGKLPNYRKYPPKLFAKHDAPFRCGTPMLRAGSVVGPPRPTLESRYKGYPLTNWKRKRLINTESMRYIRRRVLRDPRYL